MSQTVDHYHFLISPWTYLAIDRFNELRDQSGITVNCKPINPMETFDKMGGTPPPKRHPSRQRFRFDELKRWSAYLGIPLNLTPAFFPADQTLAAQMVFASGGADGNLDASRFSDAVLTAVWKEERNIADESTLISIADEVGLDGKQLIEKARTDEFVTLYVNTTEEAHNRDVFGSPTYVVNDENFWGQDRLDFLQRYLQELA
ncbi:MAG: 2-hydroxychromene-2-carboxylate isomerase [Granulosicoccus sp.]|nr:2-hydroxychromene-2-carboxylate isomerase [Granulosicoccus sp.]